MDYFKNLSDSLRELFALVEKKGFFSGEHRLQLHVGYGIGSDVKAQCFEIELNNKLLSKCYLSCMIESFMRKISKNVKLYSMDAFIFDASGCVVLNEEKIITAK